MPPPTQRRRWPRALSVALARALAAEAVPRGLQTILEDIAKAKNAKHNCSFSIAYRDTSGTAAAAHGTVDFGSGTRATVEDRYPFGSITKVLTGASVLRLVAEGAFGLDAEVAPLVDPLLAAMASAHPSQWFRSMADLWGEGNVSGTTVRQLLGMQSGVPDFDTAQPCMPMERGCVPRDPLRATLYADPAHGYNPAELMAVPWVRGRWRGPCRPRHPEVPSFCYSSTNFMLLGFILAARATPSWRDFDQASFLPPSLRSRIQFALWGNPRDYTTVHGYDRTSYNVPRGQHNDHDNIDVEGVFSGWTASDIVATPAAVNDLVWDVYGPPHSVAPRRYADLMVPTTGFYGLATFSLSSFVGQRPGSRYGTAYGHLGATYGYQSITAYFPALEMAITVATNIETDYQPQAAEGLCFAYNAAAGLLLNRTIRCTFEPKSFYEGGCRCDPIEDGAERVEATAERASIPAARARATLVV